MPLRTATLILFDATEAPEMIERAAALALGFDAHLTALHPFNPVLIQPGLGTAPTIYSTMLDWEEAEAARIRALFEEAIRKNGIQGEYRSQPGLYGAEAFLLDGARSADVVVMGAVADRSLDDRILAHRLVREVGRPVLVLGSQARLEAPPGRIVVGWSDTREATRAAHDAIGIAAPGAEILLVSLHSRADEVAQGLRCREDLAAALDRAGFAVTVEDQPAEAGDRAGELVRMAREFDADILATGAFGHSQIYDMFVGAVTRDLMHEAPLPVLLSH